MTDDDWKRQSDIRFERMEKKFDMLAEALMRFDEKMDRRFDALEAAIARTAAETQAMIRFSHAELDRRMRVLEETVIDLKARVERLESGPQ